MGKFTYQEEIKRICSIALNDERKSVGGGAETFLLFSFFCFLVFIALPAGPVCFPDRLLVACDNNGASAATPLSGISQIPHLCTHGLCLANMSDGFAEHLSQREQQHFHLHKGRRKAHV